MVAVVPYRRNRAPVVALTRMFNLDPDVLVRRFVPDSRRCTRLPPPEPPEVVIVSVAGKTLREVQVHVPCVPVDRVDAWRSFQPEARKPSTRIERAPRTEARNAALDPLIRRLGRELDDPAAIPRAFGEIYVLLQIGIPPAILHASQVQVQRACTVVSLATACGGQVRHYTASSAADPSRLSTAVAFCASASHCRTM